MRRLRAEKVCERFDVRLRDQETAMMRGRTTYIMKFSELCATCAQATDADAGGGLQVWPIFCSLGGMLVGLSIWAI